MQGMKYCPLPLYVWSVSSAAAVGSSLWRGDRLYSVVTSHKLLRTVLPLLFAYQYAFYST